MVQKSPVTLGLPYQVACMILLVTENYSFCSSGYSHAHNNNFEPAPRGKEAASPIK